MCRPSVPRPLLLRPPAVLLNLLLLKLLRKISAVLADCPGESAAQGLGQLYEQNLAGRLASIRASGKSTSAQEAELADLEAVPSRRF